MFKNSNKKAGFTLSEVLITLGVLGILGAILIPIVTKTVPSKNKALFRKAYFTTEKVIEEMINDETIYPSSETTTISSVVYQDGFAYKTDPTGEAGTTNKFCYYFTQNLNTTGEVTCPDTSWNGGTITEIATTNDGIVWFLSNNTSMTAFEVRVPGSRYYSTHIIIDVNGKTNEPNCTSDTHGDASSGYKITPSYASKCLNEKNPDIYSIGVTYDGKLSATSSHWSESNVTTSASTNLVAEEILTSPTDNVKK